MIKICLVQVICIFMIASLYLVEVCSTEEFIAKCESHHVILITAGHYGRMRIGRCVRVDFGFVGCYTDVINILDQHCSGRVECQLKIPDPEMDETKPCLADLTRYLTAGYICVPGKSVLVIHSYIYRACNFWYCHCLWWSFIAVSRMVVSYETCLLIPQKMTLCVFCGVNDEEGWEISVIMRLISPLCGLLPLKDELVSRCALQQNIWLL